MDDKQKIAYEYLDHAQKALRAGDLPLAKEYCDLAESTDATLEEVWLLKASLAEPADSIEYLNKALEINPGSERAQKGLIWAQQRLNGLSGLAQNEVVSEEPVEEVVSEEPEQIESLDKNPFKIGNADDEVESTENASATQELKAVLNEKPTKPSPTGKQGWLRWAIAPLSILLLVLAIVFGSYYRSTISEKLDPIVGQGVIASNGETLDGLPATNTSLPTVTEATTESAATTSEETNGAASGNSATSEPTSTSVPTHTATVTSTATSAPTNTVVPSRTPAPTATFVPVVSTLTEYDMEPTATAQTQVLMTVTPDPKWIGVPSPTPLPTDTDEPQAYQQPVATPVVSVPVNSDGIRWIDIDLSHHMLYAYQGDQMVNAFVISSGTWQYPTVTGTYSVYVKYLYKDMSGADYYLPDVPYTMFFFEGYAIHGTYWHNNFGVPMSHGCVNMSIPDSAWVYQWASVGTQVNVHY